MCVRTCLCTCVYACLCTCVGGCLVWCVYEHMCACLCIRVCIPEETMVTLLHAGMHTCILSISCSSCSLFRFLGCRGFPGACMTVLCTRCQPHPNMQPLLLLSNLRLPNTSLHRSETSTSPTSVYQVRNYSGQGSPPHSGPQSPELLRKESTASGARSGAGDGSVGSPPLPGLGREGWGRSESREGPWEQHRDT